MAKVVKFGGSSLADAKQIMKAAGIIKQDSDRRYVIVSAPGKRDSKDTKITDMLINCYELAAAKKDYSRVFNKIKKRYEDIVKGLRLRLSLEDEFKQIDKVLQENPYRDFAASRGEYLNSIIIARYLGYTWIDAAETVRFGKNGFLADETNALLEEKLKNIKHVVIAGFYGADAKGRIVTFSRGGSDITGSIVARAIKADIYENWTDVSGVLVADPHIIDNPKVIHTITYRELRELSYMGASVLHEDAIFPVRKAGIPINIRNTNKPDDEGTMIVESTCRIPEYTITGVAGKKGFAAVNIEKDMMNSEVGYCRKILSAFEDNDVNIEHMPSGIDTMTVIVHQEEFEGKEQRVLASIHKYTEFDQIDMESDLALIAVVGRGMKSQRGTASRIFAALSHAGVNIRMIDQGSSELNIIVAVAGEDFEVAIKAIYDIFVETRI